MKNQDYTQEIQEKREFVKSNFATSAVIPDQQRGLPQPPLCKPPMAANNIPLPTQFSGELVQPQYLSLLQQRRSRRQFTPQPLSLGQLGFLLWSTQGVQKVIGKTNQATLRPVPSGGCRHPIETYIAVQRVEGLAPGLYHYLPLEHRLEFLKEIEDQQNTLAAALNGQGWAAQAAAVLFWSSIPYRGEWRYGDKAQRMILMDVGHVAQNAYLSAEAMGLGTCCIAAYNQQLCDALLGLDGEEEFTVYIAPVGVPQLKEQDQ